MSDGAGDLCGRDSVLVPIRELLDSLQAGAVQGESGGVVLVEGTAGTGKTFVLDAAATEAHRRGLHTVRVSTGAAASSPLFGPAATSRARPRVILADDVHQISPDMLAELTRLLALRDRGPVALLLALRDCTGRTDLDRLLDTVRPRPVRMVLQPLDRDAVVRLCTALLGAPPAAHLLDWILTAGGNPRLTRVLIEGLHEEGRVRVDDGLVGLAPDDRPNPALPGSVHAVVRTLLWTVGAACRQLLYTAAVLGPRPDPEVLANMLGQSTAALLPVWEEATSSEILVRTDGDLTFAHELLRRAVAESLPDAIRGALERHRDRLAAGRRYGPRPTPAAADVAGPAGDKRTATADAERPADGVTPRERTVLALLARGRSNHQIARALGISDHAVKRHVSNLLIKFGCSNRTEVALLATKRQWVGYSDAIA